MAPNGIISDEVIPLYVQDAPLCLHVKSLQLGRVGFGQSPRLVQQEVKVILTKSASRGAYSPVRGHPKGSKVVPLNSWGRVSY